MLDEQLMKCSQKECIFQRPQIYFASSFVFLDLLNSDGGVEINDSLLYNTVYASDSVPAVFILHIYCFWSVPFSSVTSFVIPLIERALSPGQ